MGILWIFKCVHYLLHMIWENNCVSSTEFIFGIIGCINLLRGCLIFFIFVCKDSTREKVFFHSILVFILQILYKVCEAILLGKVILVFKIAKLSVCGLKLSFITRARQQNNESSTSKATLVTTDSGYCR